MGFLLWKYHLEDANILLNFQILLGSKIVSTGTTTSKEIQSVIRSV